MTEDNERSIWPKGSYEEWLESELRAGRDPCIREQRGVGEEQELELIGPDKEPDDPSFPQPKRPKPSSSSETEERAATK